MKSYFLTAKDGRKPLQQAVLRALLPTEAEAPKMMEEKMEDAPEGDGDAPPPQNDDDIAAVTNVAEEAEEFDVEDGNSLASVTGVIRGGDERRRVSTVQSQYCGGFKRSNVCNLL